VRSHAPIAYPTENTPFEPHPWQVADLGEVRSGLALPLTSRDAVFGVLHVLDVTPDAFPPERASVLTSFALQAATALTNAELHQRLRETATWLEQRVKERTADLEAANKELEAFSYSVSHDLRAPLRAVDGFSRLVLNDAGPDLKPESRRHLEMIRCSVTEMNDLIAALLTFSRSTRQPIRRTSVNANDIAGAAIDAARHEAHGRNIEFRVQDLPPCRADPTLIKQVFANLISNAVKYTARADPAIVEVSGWTEGDAPVYCVRDNGVGFDPARADRLFGVFQRLHRAEEFPGNGVGLATVQRIVSRHGGRVWFEAEPGAGATFYFTVPCGRGRGMTDSGP
jgi:light-regulated signal transduction histidine kinase (bacteriophytochrome)